MASYCKDHYGLRQISDLKPEMVRSYPSHKKAEDCSVKTLEGIRTACQKLEHGVVKAYHTSERVFFPRDYKIQPFRPEDTTKIARHEPANARAMVAWAKGNLGEKTGFALETAKDMGLRSGELAQVRCCAVRLDGLTGKDIRELNGTKLKAHDKAVYREIGKGPCIYLHGSLDGAKGDRHRARNTSSPRSARPFKAGKMRRNGCSGPRSARFSPGRTGLGWRPARRESPFMGCTGHI